jgi:hypothetical protein
MPEHPHELVKGLIAQSESSKAQAQGNGWTVPEIYSDTDTGRQILRLHDAILKAGEARGYTAEVSKGRDNNTFCFLIRNERVAWRIRESYSRRKIPLSPAELKDPFNISMGKKDKTVDMPLGRLVLFVTAHYSVDKRIEAKANQSLEDRVPEILDRFEAAVAHAEMRAAEWEQFRIDSEHERAAESARETLEAVEGERWELLRNVARERGEAALLRETAELIRQRLEGSGLEKHPRAVAWMKWADSRIERLDILGRSPEAIFERLIARA